jgi:hypothetical protein
MGYERKSLQILGGSFNMLPPVDKVPITDYLLAQNWRTDSLGRLVSRWGYASKCSIPGAGIAHSAASDGGPASPYYVGCNSAITNPTSRVYYNSNPTPIATGFDGNRIAFAPQNGFMWVMNRGNQGRHSPSTGWQTWNLTPPPASPTAASGSSGSPGSSATYSYTVQGNPAYLHSLTIAGAQYSFPESLYDTALVYDPSITIASMIASGASTDPNCSVTYAGTGNNVVITPLTGGSIVPVSGSDGNTTTTLGTGSPSLPNGIYQFYLTFLSADLSLESNPSPASLAVSVSGAAITVTIPAADYPVDTRIGFVNIYATGGTLDQPCLIGQVASTAASPAGTFLDTSTDLAATQNGVVMPTQNDPPPMAAGMIGPQYSRLYAWSTAANPNRVFYTPVNQPQYWPGSGDNQVGNWFDVGLAGEAIVWCSIHTNLTVFYKERSIWILIGDPATGTLGQVVDGIGLSGQFALAPAGLIDYFVSSNGLQLFDMNECHEISANVLPLFNQSITNAGPLTVPGSVLPGSAFNSNSLSAYAVSLGHAMGKLYIAYAEQGGAYNLLVQDEGPEPETQAFIARRPGRWFYQRNSIPSTIGGFFGFFFDGTVMCGLTGAIGGAAQGFNIDDFRGFLASDPGGAAIECVYQSHFDDCGLPNNQKMYLEVAIDYELTGTAANVYVAFDNGVTPLAELGSIGILPPGTRNTLSFAFPGSVDGGILAKNISVAIDGLALGPAILHNVYVYYYVEARLAMIASTLPTDLGVGKVKECKELQLDIYAPGEMQAFIQSDLPGNGLGTRQTIAVGPMASRAIIQYPFAVTTGFLWQIALEALAATPFRLYGARLLMREIGVYIQPYESAEGFVWDSMQIALGNGEVSTLDQLRCEMEAYGAVSVTLTTDLPGEAPTTKGTYVLTTGATSRAWVTVPLPAGIEARSVQVQTTGLVAFQSAGYRIYKAQVRHFRVGRYLMGAAPDASNDAFNTLEFDYATERLKMYKRIEIDLRANGTVNMAVITDQDGDRLSTIYEPAIVTPNGRTTVVMAMPPGVRGRLLRLQLTGTAPARIYRIRVWARAVNEPKAGWKWEDFPLEASEVLPTWTDLVVEATSPTWQWIDVPFEVTEGQ